MWRLLFLKRRRGREIEPDEILLDARNLPSLNTYQFEGRFERAITKRSVAILGLGFLAVGLVFAGRSWNLMVQNGEAYAAHSENNRIRHAPVFAERGILYDRTGTELAWNAPNTDAPFAERQYIEAHGIAHLLGYLNYPSRDAQGFFYREDFIGVSGAEAFFDDILGGKNGSQLIETDAHGKIVTSNIAHLPEDGRSVTLSIDAEVTATLYSEIKSLAERVGFRAGAGIIMDIATGELLAVTSYPEYSSNTLANDNDEAAIRAYRDDPATPFLYRAASGLYTPGSIVKPFVALGALNEGTVSSQHTILSTGALVVPNPYDPSNPSIFRDWKAHGVVDMRRALAVSSDEYFYRIGGGYGGDKGLGIKEIERYFRAFGFGSIAGFGLAPEEAGVIPNPAWKEENFDGDEWRIGNTYHTAIGQYGMQVTPIQVVRAVAALANGGTLVTPRIDRSESDEYLETLKHPVPIKIDEHMFDVVREGMRLAVTGGTAQGLSMYNLQVAAKTGTAELGAEKRYVNSWVTGFFPYEEPKYAFAVVMERGPVENLTGATYVMRRVLEWMSTTTPEYLK